jgi:hypothetical protein
MKWITLQLHKEAILLCEEWITPVETQNALLVPQNSKSATMMKPQMEPKKNGKHCRNCG